MSVNTCPTARIQGKEKLLKVVEKCTDAFCRNERSQYELEYEANGEGCFIFEVQHPKTGAWLCIDATRGYGHVGRLINHSTRPNLKGKVALVNGRVRLGLLASRDISEGEELTIDYGQQPRAPGWLKRRPTVNQVLCCQFVSKSI